MTFAFQHPLFLSSFAGTSLNTRSCPTRLIQLKMLTQLPDGGVTTAKGFKAAGHTAGFKPSGLPDLSVVMTDDNTPTTAAALFTKNIVRAAPVEISEQNMADSASKIAAIVLNSGQANAGTGDGGFQDAVETTKIASQALGCSPCNIFLCSTGVIGHRFDINLMRTALPEVIDIAASTLDAGNAAANAIMTTDLKPKQVAFEDVIGGKKVTIGGMCKGSGMIHPEMATMLGVVTCDADVEPSLWQDMLRKACDKSFNVITVDGDTSTNDVVCALCSGASGLSVSDAASPEAQAVEALLTKTCEYLAKSIARDGEGATVLVEVQATGAASDEEARSIARTVVGSSLFKAAVYGRDPNWGRIAAAAGRARAKFDQTNMKISLGGYLLLENGTPVSFDAAEVSNYMKLKAEAGTEHYLSEHDTVVVEIDVGAGTGSGVAWGCDLSYDYVKINADYTT